MKGAIDGMFGNAMSKMRSAAKKQIINKAEHVQQILHERAGPEDHVELLIPKVEREQYVIEHPSVRARTLPSKIKSSYVWNFQRKDRRRKGGLGQDGTTITEIKAVWVLNG